MAKGKTKDSVVTESKTKKGPGISIAKHFQLSDPRIHKYTRAALEVQFRGIIKSETEWDSELASHIEGVTK